MLLTKIVRITLFGRDRKMKWFRERGYNIPFVYDKKRKRYKNPDSIDLEIKVEDIPPTCRTIKIEFCCDYCLEENINNVIEINWHDYMNHDKRIVNKDTCIKHIYRKQLEMKNIFYSISFTSELIKQKYINLYNRINKIPTIADITKEFHQNKTFPSIWTIHKFYGTLNKLKDEALPDIYRIRLIDDLQKYIKEHGFPTYSDFNYSNNLKIVRTYQQQFKVKKISEIVRLCGFNFTSEEEYFMNKYSGSSYNRISKEECIKIIYNMQSKLNRPLMYDDFRHPTFGKLGIDHVRYYWNTLNEMKKDLRLEIIQENMIIKHKCFNDIKSDMDFICKSVFKNEKRNLLIKQDFIDYSPGLTYQCYSKLFKTNGITLREYLKRKGFQLLKPGSGYNYVFEDGERVFSGYEYLFSKLLRKNNFKYNIDYFRDTNYSLFINNYRGYMNCDYIIQSGGNKIYIEIAGILRNRQKKYYEESVFPSKSKQKYAEKLRLKEKLLQNNNLQHYIFFPYDYKNNLVKDMEKVISKFS